MVTRQLSSRIVTSELRFRLRGKFLAAARQLRAWPLWGLAHRGSGVTVARPRRVDGRDNISIGRNSLILRTCWIQAVSSYAGQAYRPTITIGENFYAGPGLNMTTGTDLTIGDNVTVSGYVYLIGTEHGKVDGRVSMSAPLVDCDPIVIGSGCFLGAGAKILPGVTLGANCQVGANAVVTKSFPAGSIIGGVPARLIKTIPAA
jgi:acetyltransferase-like isoleucine patch superfamily enzyme